MFCAFPLIVNIAFDKTDKNVPSHDFMKSAYPGPSIGLTWTASSWHEDWSNQNNHKAYENAFYGCKHNISVQVQM